MRQPQYGKTESENISLTISKKKNTKRNKRTWNRRRSRVTMEKLECINDALRFHQPYGTQASWKLIPKDSCEVYKAQRKRANNPRGNKTKPGGSGNDKKTNKRSSRKAHSDGDRSMSDESRSRERPAKAPKKVKRNIKRRKKYKAPKRHSSDESVSSHATYSGTSMSTPYSSDMDR